MHTPLYITFDLMYLILNTIIGLLQSTAGLMDHSDRFWASRIQILTAILRKTRK